MRVQNDLNSNPIELVILVIVMFWTFVVTFLCCECAQLVANRFDEFDDGLGQCDWHLLPTDVQQMLLIFMQSTQQPAVFQGYGQIDGSRDTFKKVTRVCFEIV